MSDESHSSFFEELKRRSVFRAGAAHVLVSWIVIQVADTVFPYIGLSERIVTFLIVFLAIGFVITLIVSWAYELTPQGLKRDDEVERAGAAKRKPGLRSFDYVIAAILTAIIAVYAFNQLPQQTISGSSIAVLPFENRSANPDDVYFVDGVHDDILTSLANIGSLKVISRTSVERFTGTDRSIPEIGAELGVTAILEGGMQRAGGTIRLNVQLIDVATDSHLWAKIYDRDLTVENIFAIQSEIATTIASELRAALTPEEETRLVQARTDNLEAYNLYLLGNQRIRRRSGDYLEQALDYFREAIELDPNFALAWVGLADSYKLLNVYGGADWGRAQTLQPSLEAAERAIELDPTLGEAYASLAIIHYEFNTGEDPEPLFRRAIELNANYAPARQWYAGFLGSNDRVEEARIQHERALELDPLSPNANVQLGIHYRATGRLEEARAQFLRAIEIDPQFARAFQLLAPLYSQYGQHGHALLAVDEAYRLNPSQADLLLRKVWPLIALNDYVEAENVIEEVARRDPEANVSVAKIQLHYALGGDEAVEAARQYWDMENIRGFNKTILTNHYVRTGRIDEAIQLLESVEGTYGLPAAPEASSIYRGNGITAIQYADVLKRAGRIAEMETWIEPLLAYYGEQLAVLDTIAEPTQGQLFNLVLSAQVHVVRGDNAQALGLLRRAVDAGWSSGWFYYFDSDPVFDALRDEPDFQAMRKTVSDRMAAQLAAYRAGEITLDLSRRGQ